MTDPFLDLLKVRPVIFDGAMGTSILGRQLTDDDFGGQKDCPEILVATRPEVIRDIHAAFLAVGCDAVETNSFGSGRIVLGEFGLEDRVHELNRKAAEVARAACDEFRTPDRPRFVAGSIGPGTRLVTLGHVTFDVLRDVYEEQSLGLLDGGADVLLIETCQDILQSKAAVIAALDAMEKHGRRVPVMVQVTIEQQGTMLLGTEIGAAMVTLEALPVDVIGLNCGTGPKEMVEAVRHLSQHCTRFLSVLPNAGLPENVGGQAHYHLTPDELAAYLKRFVVEFGVNVVGGCCGTTPAHLAKVVEALRGVQPAPRTPDSPAAVSSLFSAAELVQDPRPLIIGERTNTNGSREFKKKLEQGDMEGMVAMARDQEHEGPTSSTSARPTSAATRSGTCARSSGGSTSASRSRS